MRFLWSTLGSSRTSRRCWNGWSRYYLIDMFASPSTIFSKVDQEPEQRRRRRHHRGDERGAAGDHGGQHDHVTGAPLLYILYQELSSPIFQSQSVSQSVRHPWHPSRSPLCAVYKGINALYWPSIINYQLLLPYSVLFWPSTQLHHLVKHSWANWI